MSSSSTIERGILADSSEPYIRRVDWHDPIAVDLRAAMDKEIAPRYAGRFDGLDAKTVAQLGVAFSIDPAEIVATFVLVADGKAVAHAALRKLGDEWELKRLVTLPAHRGKGYSRDIIARIEAEVLAQGGSRLVLQTGDRQPEAVALYRRLGYYSIPTFEPYRVFEQSQCFARDLVSPLDPKVHFRLARRDEFGAVGELTYVAYTSDYANLPEEYSSELRSPERLLPEYDVWIAEQSSTNELVGTVAVLREGFEHDDIAPDELYFRLLAVAPSARRRGIGKALTRLVLDLARARGSARVVLNSGDQMLGAHALYRALAFQRQPEREHVIVLSTGQINILAFALEITP